MSFVSEFKEFISRGNVMDMAVGVVVGGAFSSIVTSLVDDIIGPIIGVISGGIDFSGLAITLGSANIAVGSFIQAIIKFLIISLVIFSVIKAFNTAANKLKKPVEEAAPTTKICPFCMSEVDIKASKCKFCASELK